MECSLESGDLLTVQGAKDGIVLHCLRGTLWLTQGDGVDRLVHGGTRFEVTAGTSALVEAMGEAGFRLEATDGRAAGPSRALFLRPCRAIG